MARDRLRGARLGPLGHPYSYRRPGHGHRRARWSPSAPTSATVAARVVDLRQLPGQLPTADVRDHECATAQERFVKNLQPHGPKAEEGIVASSRWLVRAES